jgi:hypothetical protein
VLGTGDGPPAPAPELLLPPLEPPLDAEVPTRPPVTYRTPRHTHLISPDGWGDRRGENRRAARTLIRDHDAKNLAHRFRKRDDKAAPLPMAPFFSTEPGGNLVAVFAFVLAANIANCLIFQVWKGGRVV